VSVQEPEEPPINPGEFRATMWLIADIRDEVIAIRGLLEDDDGEEAPEADDT
jgi:hypothetical protein